MAKPMDVNQLFYELLAKACEEWSPDRAGEGGRKPHLADLYARMDDMYAGLRGHGVDEGKALEMVREGSAQAVALARSQKETA